VVWRTRWQVEKFVDRELGYLPLYDACKKLWYFIKEHIGYKKDEPGKEQVRSPRRLFWEKIGDCDCYTVFISACVSLLNKGEKIMLRITKYGKPHFQHIYPVVITSGGEHIAMDCVTEKFNYEEPYTEKKDYHMELTYLDGLPGNPSVDYIEQENDLGKLLNIFKKKNEPAQNQSKPGVIKQIVDKGKQVVSKAVNVVNKVNPATVLLRAGILAAMKLNFMKIAQRLKYAYLSDAQAQQRGADMNKFHQLKQVREKLEKIFFGAGGKPENLKEAILTGKGNTKREIPLSGLSGSYDPAVINMHEQSPLTKLLGQEVYYSEFMQGVQTLSGLGELGEPATAASITAATGVLAAVAALLKNIVNLFPKKDTASADFEDVQDVEKEMENLKTTDTSGDFDFEKYVSEFETQQQKDSATESTLQKKNADKNDAKQQETFWQKNKKWLKPSLWGAGILSALGIGYAVLKPKKKKEKSKALDGIKSKKKAGKKIKSVELK
jgi:hypothetical protein